MQDKNKMPPKTVKFKIMVVATLRVDCQTCGHCLQCSVLRFTIMRQLNCTADQYLALLQSGKVLSPFWINSKSRNEEEIK